MKELSKIYDPKQVEDRTYQFWLDGGYFHAEPNPDKKPYTIVIPPPNITGQLHMGHALDETLQDILIRFRRMQGYEALWPPYLRFHSQARSKKPSRPRSSLVRPSSFIALTILASVAMEAWSVPGSQSAS